MPISRSPMPYVCADEIEAAAALPALVEELRDALAQGLRREATIPLRTLIAREQPFGVFGSMPAYSPQLGLFATKIATFVERPDGARPSVQAIVLAFAADTGALIAALDGAAMTALKCAAVTAVVTDCCAALDARSLGLIGTGVQARAQLRAVSAVRRIETVRVYSRDPAHVERFVRAASASLARSVAIEGCAAADDAVDGADIVSTATTSSHPVFSTRRFPGHVHINCIGAHTTEFREVSGELLSQSIIIVEDVATALAEAGSVHQGALDLEQMLTHDAVVLRTTPTVFSSTGHAFLDLVTTAHILQRLGVASAPAL